MFAMLTSWIRWNFDQNGFQFTWINSDTLRVCYSVNWALSHTACFQHIYKHMKRAATHLFKRKSKNRAFFSKLSNFYLDFRPPPRGRPRTRQRSENPTPGATRMCESLGIARGEGMVRLGIDWCIMMTSIDHSQEIFSIDMLTALWCLATEKKGKSDKTEPIV